MALFQLGCATFLTKVGGAPAIIDDEVARGAESLGDTELLSDVKALHNKQLKGAEVSAGLCLQQYVRGRAAEAELASATDDNARRMVESEVLGGYMSCAAQCEVAAGLQSDYSAMAQKYRAPCEAGSSASVETVQTDHLEQLVEIHRKASYPLELFFADRDAAGALQYLQDENMMNETSAELATEIEGLRATHSEAIEQGRAFFEGPDAQANFQKRAANEAEQASIESKIQRLTNERDEAERVGLTERARNLEVEIRAEQEHLAATIVGHAELKKQYETMAADAGVYR